MKIFKFVKEMKKVAAMLFCFLMIMNVSQSQNIHLSNGIGDVNCRYSYGKVIRALGKPDSTYSFDPITINPIPKSVAISELFYDQKHVSVLFMYSSWDKLKRKSGVSCITLFKGSSFTLNGDSLSVMDSAYVVKKYGKPRHILKATNELTIDYDFREGKYFSLLTFYFDGEGELTEIRIHFGRY